MAFVIMAVIALENKLQPEPGDFEFAWSRGFACPPDAVRQARIKRGVGGWCQSTQTTAAQGAAATLRTGVR